MKPFRLTSPPTPYPMPGLPELGMPEARARYGVICNGPHGRPTRKEAARRVQAAAEERERLRDAAESLRQLCLDWRDANG